MDGLSKEDRMHLMRFVCSFAWADLEIQAEERAFVGKLMDSLELDADERAQVDEWLRTPPPPEDVDPTDIKKEHRDLFISTARAMIVSDGHVDRDEAENLALLEMLSESFG